MAFRELQGHQETFDRRLAPRRVRTTLRTSSRQGSPHNASARRVCGSSSGSGGGRGGVLKASGASGGVRQQSGTARGQNNFEVLFSSGVPLTIPVRWGLVVVVGDELRRLQGSQKDPNT